MYSKQRMSAPARRGIANTRSATRHARLSRRHADRRARSGQRDAPPAPVLRAQPFVPVQRNHPARHGRWPGRETRQATRDDADCEEHVRVSPDLQAGILASDGRGRAAKSGSQACPARCEPRGLLALRAARVGADLGVQLRRALHQLGGVCARADGGRPDRRARAAQARPQRAPDGPLRLLPDALRPERRAHGRAARRRTQVHRPARDARGRAAALVRPALLPEAGHLQLPLDLRRVRRPHGSLVRGAACGAAAGAAAAAGFFPTGGGAARAAGEPHRDALCALSAQPATVARCVRAFRGATHCLRGKPVKSVGRRASGAATALARSEAPRYPPPPLNPDVC